MQVVRVRPGLRRLPFAPGGPAACRARLRIGYRVTGGQLRVTVQLACRTPTARAFTTLVWAASMDDCSRRLLTEALRTAGQPPCAVRLCAFAAAARDVFRHVSKSLAPGPARRPPVVHLAGERRPPEVAAAPAALLAAVDDLRASTRRCLPLAASDRPAADRRIGAALSALHGLFALLNSYLEEVLRLHAPHVVARQALCASILQTHSGLDRLAACPAAGGVFREALHLGKPRRHAIHVEVEASLAAPLP